MAVFSDMNSFPESGFPVLANVYDQICLNTIYWNPLVSSGYVIDANGAVRLGVVGITAAGAITGVTTLNASGAITGVGIVAGGAISGATTIGASGTVTLSKATDPLVLSGATAVLSMTGQDSVFSMTGMNSSIGTLLSRIPKAYIKDLEVTNTPTVQGQPLVLQQDLVNYVPCTGCQQNVNLGSKDITTSGNIKGIHKSTDDSVGATTSVAVAKVGGGTRTLNFKNGLYIDYTDS